MHAVPDVGRYSISVKGLVCWSHVRVGWSIPVTNGVPHKLRVLAKLVIAVASLLIGGGIL